MKFEQYFDHTILKQDATKDQVKKICAEAREHGFASVCVNSYYTAYVTEQLKGSGVKTCVVVGFPLGMAASDVKAYETAFAIRKGADEIDMVINTGLMKDKDYTGVFRDIKTVREACDNVGKSMGKEHIILKVIIETCLLTEEEKIKMCELVTNAGAEYIKTSTGFSIAGATFDDVKLMHDHVGEGVKVKAAGGISSFDDAEKFIELGADRLGTSRLVKIMKNTDTGAGY